MEDRYLAGLYDGCSQEDRQLVVQYLQYLQTSHDGWKLCAIDFTEKIHKDDPARFFCLQVIENHIKTRHFSSSEEDRLSLQTLMFTFIKQSNVYRQEKGFVKKKMAQLIALTFITDYPNKWSQFFIELLSMLEDESCSWWTVEIYLRSLLAIDEEIVDRDIVHTPEENIRNTLIKDHIRDTCAESLTKSWFRIMTMFESNDVEITHLAMEVVGAYVSWMDIGLIVNDTNISMLLKYLSVQSLRESAADCFHDILSKGMDPLSKLQLTQSLFVVLEESQIITATQTDENFDFLEKLSKLVNRVGLGLLTCYSQFIRAGEHETAFTCFAAVEAKIPYLLRFLCDEDDGVSENILPFAVQYITTLKHMDNLTESTKQNVQSLLCGVIKKLTYDETFNFIQPGEDEALFIEFRVRLKVLYDNISLLDPKLTMECVQGHISKVLTNLSSEPFMNVEVVLLLATYLGDNYFEKVFGGANSQLSPLYHLMNMIVESDLSSHTHSAVLLQYYDVITKHEKFFTVSTNHIPGILTCFIDHRGLHNANASVRSRVCYKFLQFLKSLRSQIGDYSIDILQLLQDLLLSPNVGLKVPGAIMPNDMLFLFEAAGYLSVYSNTTPENKADLMRTFLNSLLEKFNLYLTKLYSAPTDSLQEEIGQVLYQLMSYASRMSKVFSNHHQAKLSGCLQPFEEALPTILKGLEITVQREVLQSGVRQYLHRMIISMGDELFNYIPLAVTLLLKDCQSRDMQEFIPLVNQLITKYKIKIVPMVQEIFLPVSSTIIASLARPFDPNDPEESRDRSSLQKSYYLFLNSIAVNDILIAITNLGTSQFNEVLKMLIEGTNHSEHAIQRVSFQTLKKLIQFCGGSNVPVPGFMEFVYKDVIPACFLVPLKAFDLEDAQAFLATGEIAGILKVLVNLYGEQFLLFLQNEFFPSIQMPQPISTELLTNIQQTDVKMLKSYLKECFITLRNII